MVFRCFIALFGYPCCILTQCGIYFSIFLFVQATIHSLSIFTEQSLLNTILKTILLYLVLYHMVFSTSLQHKWSMTLMILRTKNQKINFQNPNL